MTDAEIPIGNVVGDKEKPGSDALIKFFWKFMKALDDLGVMDLVSSKDIPPLIPTDPAANADERKDSGEVQDGNDTAIRKTPSAEESEKLEEGARH